MFSKVDSVPCPVHPARGRFWAGLLLAAASLNPAVGTENAEAPVASGNPPWAFNLTLYTWIAGAKGNFSAGPISQSVDASFIDINNKSRRFPLGFMGRLEAHYDRLGFYLDGDYMNLELKPRFNRISQGIDSELGVMDYGAAYRVLGPTAAEVSGMQIKGNPNWLEVYAGGRTIWLDNSVNLNAPLGNPRNGPRSFSTSKSFTSPIIGGRFMVGFSPEWFVLVDGNFGGFGAQNVQFTGAVSGAVGYRTTILDMPASIELGYKALRYNVDKGGPAQTNATLNGPFIGLTGYW
jgi:hypothetical protein